MSYSTFSPGGSCQDKVTLNFLSTNLCQTCCAQAKNKKHTGFVLSVGHIARLHNRPPQGKRLSRLLWQKAKREKQTPGHKKHTVPEVCEHHSALLISSQGLHPNFYHYFELSDSKDCSDPHKHLCLKFSSKLANQCHCHLIWTYLPLFPTINIVSTSRYRCAFVPDWNLIVKQCPKGEQNHKKGQ